VLGPRLGVLAAHRPPLNLPAYEPVPVYAVTIDGDDVLIDPPSQRCELKKELTWLFSRSATCT
jgi:hypothetical protein